MRNIIPLIGLFIVSITITLYSIYCSLNFNQLVHAVFTGNENDVAYSHRNLSYCGFQNLPLFSRLPTLLDNKTYIVLLQNNTELRPSGGFMGSYAKLNFKNGVLENWTINDIYVPDGQLKGHVDSIPPLQQAFWTGDWRLRNSNWHIDFANSSQDIEWFFQKGGEENSDGIIAVNLGLIQKWLEIIGPVKPLDFPETVTTENFYELAQRYAEEDFFPGSQRKSTYLSAVGDVLWEKTLNVNSWKKIRLAHLLLTQLQEKQILISIKNQPSQEEISRQGWDGTLGGYEQDFLYAVESNLGANKANCCIKRKIYHDVTMKTGITNTTTFKWENQNASSIAQPPLSWGGDYLNYHRVALPRDASVVKVTVNGKARTQSIKQDTIKPPTIKKDTSFTIEEYGDFQIVGFWVIVPSQEKSEAKITYNLPEPENADQYNLVVKRQPGIYELPFALTVNGKPYANQILTNDATFHIKDLY